jgi:hypothetical protein
MIGVLRLEWMSTGQQNIRCLPSGNTNITLKVYAHLFRSKDEKAADAINTALANLGEA